VEIDDETLRTWKSRLDQAEQDDGWREFWETKREKRREVLPEMVALLDDFLADRVGLEELRAQWDRKTRKEWDYFGFKGFGGAMFLNMMVKHLPEAAGVAEVLRGVLPLPDDEGAANEKLERLRRYLQRQRDEGHLTASQASESNIPFFVSSFWHIQEPAAWPPYYASVREALRNTALFEKGPDPIESYFAFRDALRSLRDALGQDVWELEALCAWEEPAPEEPEDDADEEPTHRVWLIAPGPNAALWEEQHRDGIIAIGWGHLGDLSRFDSREEIRDRLQELSGSKRRPTNDANACYQFAHEMKPGDVVVAKKGRTQVIGYGRVTSEYRYEAERGEYGNVRDVDWQHKGEWTPRERPLVLKTLTEITQYQELVQQIIRAIGVERDPDLEPHDDDEAANVVAYDLDDAAADLFIDRDEIEQAWALLRYKKNLVLTGPPGVGKTFVARRLAYLMLGEKDRRRVEVVQFHQSYSYEDFVQGYRPDEAGFVRRDGPFLRICNLARQDPDSAYVLIIDEINRGNLSKVLGELMMLIEADKRSAEWALSLSYGDEGERFHVPPNLYLIGTMNTADRSLALVDYALRRRFAFFGVAPGFSSPNFTTVLKRLGAGPGLRAHIQTGMAELNERIRSDPALGDGFEIGHSYFCAAPDGGTADEKWFANIVRFEIEPLLREYWFDSRETVTAALTLLEEEGE